MGGGGPGPRAAPPFCPDVATGSAWRVIADLIGLVLGGLVVGALGRLAIPGRDPMSLGRTILVGIGGSFLGYLVGSLLFGGRSGLLLSVLGASLIVWLLGRRRTPRLERTARGWPSQ